MIHSPLDNEQPSEMWIQWAYLADYEQEGTDWIPLPPASAIAEQTGEIWDQAINQERIK